MWTELSLFVGLPLNVDRGAERRGMGGDSFSVARVTELSAGRRVEFLGDVWKVGS